MSQALTIARPYAAAVFQHALAHHQLDNWQQLLEVLAFVTQQPQVQALLGNPAVNDKELKTFFCTICDEYNPAVMSHLGQSAWHFIALLAENKRLALLPEIATCFAALVAEQNKTAQVSVASAFELDSQRQQQLQKALTQRFACDIELDFRVDPELIGGLVIRKGNWVYDHSLKGQLNRLRQRLHEEVA